MRNRELEIQVAALACRIEGLETLLADLLADRRSSASAAEEAPTSLHPALAREAFPNPDGGYR